MRYEAPAIDDRLKLQALMFGRISGDAGGANQPVWRPAESESDVRED